MRQDVLIEIILKDSTNVLILVLMEYAPRPWCQCQEGKVVCRLNPCSNGICAKTFISIDIYLQMRKS